MNDCGKKLRSACCSVLFVIVPLLLGGSVFLRNPRFLVRIQAGEPRRAVLENFESRASKTMRDHMVDLMYALTIIALVGALSFFAFWRSKIEEKERSESMAISGKMTHQVVFSRQGKGKKAKHEVSVYSANGNYLFGTGSQGGQGYENRVDCVNMFRNFTEAVKNKTVEYVFDAPPKTVVSPEEAPKEDEGEKSEEDKGE